MRCSMWCLTEFSGMRQVFVGLRDRAMLLFGASTALRGEGTRMLQMSDLFLSELSMDDVRLGYTVPVSIRCSLVADLHQLMASRCCVGTCSTG
jgi:hypothetical protein